MSTAILDATDMGVFSDNSFDAVLNMGTFYRLIRGAKEKVHVGNSLSA